MTWAVIGANGMLGTDLVEQLEEKGLLGGKFSRVNLDLKATSDEIAQNLDNNSIIVNAAAYTKVDLAESEPDAAYFANALIPEKLAKAASLIGARLIHVSTDYVFDGNSSQPYQPKDEPNPKSVYGKSKLAGERAVLEFENTQVVRTAWLYGFHGHNFPKTIARRLSSKATLSVVNDQVGSPTHALDLAKFIIAVGLNNNEQRVLHGVSTGSVSWFGFAQEVARTIGADLDLISPIASVNYQTPASRPAYSLLSSSIIPGFKFDDWKTSWNQAASRVLNQNI
jgi:dTDP-4-dehydrorhamnose reductase